MVRMKLGEFDPPEMNPYKKLAIIHDQCMQLNDQILSNCCRLNASDYVQSKEHIQLAYEMAVQSIVLLKNNHTNGLPITSPKKKACVSPLNSIKCLHIIVLSL
jgi:beta-glucosidase-like glycosyl hydrolase